jgi:hypothetical protein
MSSSSRAADIAPPDGSDPAPAGTDTERRPETERADTRTSEGAASSEAASARASGDTTTLTTWVGTWNVGNVAPKMDAVTQWLARARGHDLVAVAAQEASYPHSRANLKPEAVWAETLAAQRGGDAEAEAARDAARLAAAEGGSTASSSDSEEPHDAAGRTACSEDASDARRADAADVAAGFAKKKRGFFGSSSFARASGALAGALAGGVAAGPLAPFGLVAGAAAGYYSSAKVAAELKSRRHWFGVVAAAMGPEYVPVQTATLLQMRLIVFARRASVMDKGLITNTRVGYQATGLLNAVGNKGGLMVRLALADGGSVAFVACHLAAHEGEKHVAARDESVAAILRGCWDGSAVRAVGETDVGQNVGQTADAEDARAFSSRRKNDEKNPSNTPVSLLKTHAGVSASSVGPELLACTSHVFVFGDLNYRVDPGMVESSPESGLRTRKTGWSSRWKKSNDAPSGSLVAAVAGLAAKTEKKKNADAAFRARDAFGLNTHTEEAISANDASAASARWVEGWLSVADLAARGRWDALAEGDQLLREISRGRALRAFSEAPLSFAPTFKLETFEAPPANAGDVTDDGGVDTRDTKNARAYAKKRVPSWCDRVLARSLSPAHACRFRAYASCPGVRTSDHAPVHASCELDFPFFPKSERTREGRSAESEGGASLAESVTLALRIRVSSFRVALEDDEESTLDDEESTLDAPAVVQSAKKETAMEALVARAARLRTKTICSVDDRKTERHHHETNTSVPLTKSDDGSLRAVSKVSPHGTRDASAGARAAMTKLTRGAVATARFFLQTTCRDFGDFGKRGDAASEGEGDETRVSDASVGAGVTCRPAQPHIERDEQRNARHPRGGTDSPRDGFVESDGSLRVSVPAVVAHWAASSLPAFERAGLCDDASLERSVRALGARVVAASVAVDKDHAGIAVIPLGDVCAAFRGETLETLRAALAALSRGAAGTSPPLASVARPFDVPFERFARRRGRAEGTLTLEIVVVRGRDGT